MGWMLDTNAVSDLLKGQDRIRARLAEVAVGDVFLSAVTAGELHYGLAKRPGMSALRESVHQLLLRVHVSPWTNEVAETYGVLRASQESQGRPLASLDTMIAAHAKHLGLILVSNDKAFRHIPGLAIEDWRS